MNILIIGAPGTGKGTMSEKLIEKYGIVHVSTGDMLRESVKNGTEVGKKAHGYMERGELVPDEVIHDIILERFAQKDMENGILMDGYPRTLAQAEDLDTILASLGKKVDCVLNLELDEQVLIGRITGRRTCPNCKAIYHIQNMPPKVEGICDICGSQLVTRKDDTVESLRVRLDAYHESTKDVIGYYEKQGIVKNINADQSVEKVFEDITEALGECND
ncbi:MAG: adenylate kinase [Erysipelotrichaceae bacterium]|nr:adenylate kinase [Erysipelotrichaceae bacterium]MBR3167381.1 adenylate kinase [Erysipelotrichaceae bacterium]MCR5300324.1 adenylate kinase [Erysipelotrichaceae bacterium]